MLIEYSLWLSNSAPLIRVSTRGAHCLAHESTRIGMPSCAVSSDVHLYLRLSTVPHRVIYSFDLTAAFTSGGKPYLTSLALDQAYVFYVTAIMPGLNNGQNLPYVMFSVGYPLSLTMAVFCSMCQFADGMGRVWWCRFSNMLLDRDFVVFLSCA